MTEQNKSQNKSQLISEAELIEAINADTLVSISLGAGQPQKNVKLSTLASVVAGLISSIVTKSGNSITDLNNSLGVSNNIVWYRCVKSESVKNAPANESAGRFYLCVSNIADSYISQFYNDLRNSKIYCRYYNGGLWSNWMAIL